MAKDIREIGIEREHFLVNYNEEVMEPKKFGFPYDEMGFLVELRSWPAERLEPIEMSLDLEKIRYAHRADKFGMRLSNSNTMHATQEFVDNIENTYHISKFPDNTQNIYSFMTRKRAGIRSGSHHTGILPNEWNCYDLTAGIHIHFSSRDKSSGKVLELPIEDIVRRMDETFKYEIEKSNRIKGEWEPKAHGFEYRSLPSDMDIHRVLREGFKILRSV